MKELKKSIKELTSNLVDLEKQYCNLNTTERESELGINLRELIKDAKIHLKNLEE